MPNRVVIPIGGAVVAVAAEAVLNRCGLLVWDWWFWRWPHVWLILLAYGLPALALVWLHDHASTPKKRRAALLLLGAAALCHLIFATGLGWI